MKHHLLLIVPLSALLLFLAVQVFMINSILKQKEELILLQYKTLSREGLNAFTIKNKANGFEKAMDVTDKFSGLLITEELPSLRSSSDSVAIIKESVPQIFSIIKKNEVLSSFLRSYIKKNGYDPEFKTLIEIINFRLLTDEGPFTIINDLPVKMKPNTIRVNTFKEEHNNFEIEYALLIDLTHKNEMVFKEAFLSLLLITVSIIIVLTVFWLTWHNLMEERRLSTLKTDFINNMTHELKTPLSTITVAGRTLEKEQILNDPRRILDTAQLIGKQSIHLNQLINTILEVSILERTEFELSRQNAEINELTHQIVASFLTSCDNCADIREDYQAGIPMISVDVLYYTTMINNLLSNAVKYCTTNPVIKICTKDEDGKISISVEDNGIGISREHLDHIFEKFYRVPHGDIHKVKGLGLGLYYVKRIAVSHGGDVSATSKPDRGTVFTLRLPK